MALLTQAICSLINRPRQFWGVNSAFLVLLDARKQTVILENPGGRCEGGFQAIVSKELKEWGLCWGLQASLRRGTSQLVYWWIQSQGHCCRFPRDLEQRWPIISDPTEFLIYRNYEITTGHWVSCYRVIITIIVITLDTVIINNIRDLSMTTERHYQIGVRKIQFCEVYKKPPRNTHGQDLMFCAVYKKPPRNTYGQDLMSSQL